MAADEVTSSEFRIVRDRALHGVAIERARIGDRSVHAVFLLDGYVQNGGVYHGTELSDEEFEAGLAGFEWLGLTEMAEVLCEAKRLDRLHESMSDEELEDDDSEHVLDERYYGLNRAIDPAIEARWSADPESFAPITESDREAYEARQQRLGRMIAGFEADGRARNP